MYTNKQIFGLKVAATTLTVATGLVLVPVVVGRALVQLGKDVGNSVTEMNRDVERQARLHNVAESCGIDNRNNA